MVSIWKYERDDLQNYLVLYLSSDCILNDFEMRMSSNLKNSFLLPIYDERHEYLHEQFTNKVDNNVDNVEIMTNRVIKYPISNVILLSKYLENSHISFDVIMNIIEGIVDIYYMCIDYLLLPEQVMFDMDKIFVDFRTNQVYMIYIPVENFGYLRDFKSFLTHYFKKVSTFDEEHSNIYADVLEYCDSGGFCMEGFKNMLSYYKKEVSAMRISRREINGDNVDFSPHDIEEYEEEIYDEQEKFVKKDLKSIMVKVGVIYTLLLLSYILAIRNSPMLFGNAFEVSLLLSFMFLAFAIYFYIKFIHGDILEVLEEKKRIKELGCDNLKRNPTIGRRNPTVSQRNLRKNNQPKYENMNKNRIMSNSARRYSNYNIDDDFSAYDDQKNRFSVNGEIRNRDADEDEYIRNKYCETELLQPRKMNYLINMTTGEKIYLTKNVFKIGRHEDENDYVLDDRTIGRFHAQIDIQREDVSITDLGSKNGTYVNENRIYPYTKSFLKVGDIIKLAGLSFSFHK